MLGTELIFTTIALIVVSLLLHGSGALGWCLNYEHLDYCTSDFEYYKYLEEFGYFLRLTDTLEKKYYVY